MKHFLFIIVLTSSIANDAAASWNLWSTYGISDRTITPAIIASFGLGCALGGFLSYYYARYKYKQTQQIKNPIAPAPAAPSKTKLDYAPQLAISIEPSDSNACDSTQVMLDQSGWGRNFSDNRGTNSLQSDEGISISIDIGKRINALKAFISTIEQNTCDLDDAETHFGPTIHNLINLVDRCALCDFMLKSSNPEMVREYRELQWKAVGLLGKFNHHKSAYLNIIYARTY